jgi:hypothetical protein
MFIEIRNAEVSDTTGDATGVAACNTKIISIIITSVMINVKQIVVPADLFFPVIFYTP